MIRNNKGQAFEAYQLLIAFIISVAILGIIIMMVNKTNDQAIIISNQKIEDAFISAINSPIISMQKPFVVKDVLVRGIISNSRYENLGNIEEGCFSFIVGPGVKLENYGAVIDKKYLKTDVYFVCGLSEMSPFDLDDPDTFNQITMGTNAPLPNYNDCERLFCVMYINKIPASLTN